MGQFMYFLPGESAAGPGVLDKFGLSRRMQPGVAQRVVTGAGVVAHDLCDPQAEGAAIYPGVLVGLVPDGERQINFAPAEQEWRAHNPAPALPDTGPEWFLGWWRDDPPSEADLARPDGVAGYAVVLGDGGRWTVPAVRNYPEGSALPATFHLEADGTEVAILRGEMLELFTEVAEHADRYYEQARQVMSGAEFDELIDDVPLRLIYRALAVNYWVGPDEINALGLLTTVSRQAAQLSMMDWPAFLALTQPAPSPVADEDDAEKKTEAAPQE